MRISPNAHYLPLPPPQSLHNLCSSFLLGIIAVPREINNKGYTKFGRGGGGANKVHYVANRLFSSSSWPLYQNEVKCSAFDMALILLPHAMKTIFTRKVLHLASF